MNKTLLTLKIRIPTYEDDYNPEYIDFGNILSTKKDIENYFYSFDDKKKQELFDDYKIYLEGTYNNRVQNNLGNSSLDEMLNTESQLRNKVKEKYKFDINKLIQLFFNKPLNNSYEYNLLRGIEQNFVKLDTVYNSSSSNDKHIETKYSVYEVNKFNFDEYSIIISELSYIEL